MYMNGMSPVSQSCACLQMAHWLSARWRLQLPAQCRIYRISYCLIILVGQWVQHSSNMQGERRAEEQTQQQGQQPPQRPQWSHTAHWHRERALQAEGCGAQPWGSFSAHLCCHVLSEGQTHLPHSPHPPHACWLPAKLPQGVLQLLFSPHCCCSRLCHNVLPEVLIAIIMP